MGLGIFLRNFFQDHFWQDDFWQEIVQPEEFMLNLILSSDMESSLPWTEGAGWLVNDSASGVAAYISTGADSSLQQDTLALVEGATYKVVFTASGVSLTSGNFSVSLAGGVAGTFTKPGTHTFYLVAGSTLTDGFEIASVNTTASDTLTIDNPAVYVEHFKPSTSLNSVFFTADTQVPDGAAGLDNGPTDKYLDTGSTTGGEIVYRSTLNHSNGSGGLAKYFLWFNGSAWVISRTVTVTTGPSWISSGSIIDDYTPITSAPQSIGTGAVTFGPVSHSQVSGSAGLDTDGISGYIDLKTSHDFLNGLRGGKFGIVSVYNATKGTGSGRLLSAETSVNTSFRAISLSDTQSRYQWTGTSPLNVDADIADNEIHNVSLTVDALTLEDAWINADGLLSETDSTVSGLDVADSTQLTLGATAYAHDLFNIGKFGFTAILDFSAVTTVNEAWSTDLSEAINTAAIKSNYNAHSIAAAILDYDSNITGFYWALNELNTGDASDYYLLAYNIETQVAQTGDFYGLVSDSGVAGVILASAGGGYRGAGYRGRYNGLYRPRYA